MKNTQEKLQKAILVGIQLPQQSEAEVASSLDELSRLVNTLGYQPVARLQQKRNSTKGAVVLGDGKLKELANWTGGLGVVNTGFKKKLSKAAQKFEKNASQDSEEYFNEDELQLHDEQDLIFDSATEIDSEAKPATEKVDIAIFDCELTPSQLRNLESALGCLVLDRTGVIIEIFNRHARTKAARLQVEIARLTYIAPRIRETGIESERQGGKGAGETTIELDRRKIRDRIKELKTELTAMNSEQIVRRAKRNQVNTVALVGYTNAGKSSLMRLLTGSEVYVADKLFATLDTTVRPLYPDSVPKILISDTVGFIKKLPHDLVASFKSTLDEALHASLLLYVVDCSDPSFRQQLKVTQEVLAEVGVEDTPSQLVLNKVDQLNNVEIEILKTEFPDALLISTHNPIDIKRVRLFLIEKFEAGMIDKIIKISYQHSNLVGELRSSFRVISESYDENGFVFKIRGDEALIEQLINKHHLR